MPVIKRPISHRRLLHRRRGRHARRNPVARPNGFLDAFVGIATGGVSTVVDNLNLSKKEQYTNAVEQEALFRTRYLTCKKKLENQGKGDKVFPKGKRCKAKHKKWQKWQSKKAKLAQELGSKLEEKGQLHPALEAQLVEDQVVVTDPELTAPSTILPDDIPETEVEGETALPAMPWLALGGAAAIGTIALIFLLRR